MKKYRVVGALFLFSISLFTQEIEKDRWDKFDRLCGRLESTWSVPEGKHPKYSVEHRKAIGKAPMELFEWREGATCCSGLTLVERVVTQRNGDFEFKNARPGKYFLVAHANGGSPNMAIIVTGEKSKPEVCSEQGVDVNAEGRLQKFLTVTVD